MECSLYHLSKMVEKVIGGTSLLSPLYPELSLCMCVVACVPQISPCNPEIKMPVAFPSWWDGYSISWLERRGDGALCSWSPPSTVECSPKWTGVRERWHKRSLRRLGSRRVSKCLQKFSRFSRRGKKHHLLYAISRTLWWVFACIVFSHVMGWVVSLGIHMLKSDAQ